MKIEDVESKVIELWENSKSIADISNKIFGYYNGRKFYLIKNIAEKNDLDFEVINNNLLKSKRNYQLIEKNCPVCGIKFISKEGHKREKQTCSYACANSHFRSGLNNGNWSDSAYRSTCFYYHKKECVVCGENRIVEVHHFDENRKNNKSENLIPLCPTHHQYWHSNYKNLIYNKINEYRNNFIINSTS